jgi:uncharacterized membrane protein YgcG
MLVWRPRSFSRSANLTFTIRLISLWIWLFSSLLRRWICVEHSVTGR